MGTNTLAKSLRSWFAEGLGDTSNTFKSLTRFAGLKSAWNFGSGVCEWIVLTNPSEASVCDFMQGVENNCCWKVIHSGMAAMDTGADVIRDLSCGFVKVIYGMVVD